MPPPPTRSPGCCFGRRRPRERGASARSPSSSASPPRAARRPPAAATPPTTARSCAWTTAPTTTSTRGARARPTSRLVEDPGNGTRADRLAALTDGEMHALLAGNRREQTDPHPHVLPRLHRARALRQCEGWPVSTAQPL